MTSENKLVDVVSENYQQCIKNGFVERSHETRRAFEEGWLSCSRQQEGAMLERETTHILHIISFMTGLVGMCLVGTVLFVFFAGTLNNSVSANYIIAAGALLLLLSFGLNRLSRAVVDKAKDEQDDTSDA